MRPASVRAAAFLAVVAAVGMLGPSTSRAAGARVAIWVEGGTDAFAARLAAELSAVGLETVMVHDGAGPAAPGGPAGPAGGAEAPGKAPGAGAREALEAAARREGAIAAVRVVPSRGGVEVWIVDRVTGKTVLREVLPAGGAQQQQEMVALRAVELLRASLLEVRDRSHPARGDVAAPAALSALLPPAAPPSNTPAEPVALRVSVGPGLAMSPGGVGTSGHLFLGLSYLPGGRLSFEALSLLPAVPSTVTAPEGTATVSKGLAGGGFSLALPLGAGLEASGGGGLVAAWLRMDGAATAPYASRSDSVYTLLPYVRAGLSLALGQRTRLASGALLGVATPRPVVSFAGRDVASWGRPALGTWLAIEIALR
jgi:hypothetical protein